MIFNIFTIFPEAFSYLNESILKQAQKKGLVEIKIHNLRDFTDEKHRKVDDRSYGGGPGMIIKIEPLARAILSLKLKAKNPKLKVVLFTPSGEQFNSKIAAGLAKNYKQLVLVCGHYEGIDERIKKIIYDSEIKIQEISAGPYVLTGGELPAMVLIDAVSRHLPGVLGKAESLEEKRLGVGVPVYTRPEAFAWPPSSRGKKKKEYRVPKILLSGNHQKIAEWRAQHRKE